MKTISIVYITTPTAEVARKIAQTLLEKRVIACANIFRSRSLYHWKGKMVDEGEWVVWAKTFPDKVETVKKEVERIHPYAIPCTISFEVHVNSAYAQWVEREVRAR